MSKRSINLVLLGFATVTTVTVADLKGQIPQEPGTRDIVHLLNRVAYGPRPGDVERVLNSGISSYLDQQLSFETILDSALDRAVAGYSITQFSREELSEIDGETRRMIRERRSSAGTGGMAGPQNDALGRRRRDERRRRTEFQQIAVLRAVSSQRQLYEILVEFWTNHFNVYMAKGIDRFLTPDYIENAIRPYAMGRFRDLLGATARSPAMLFYLDNASSVATGSKPPQLALLERRRERMSRRGANTARLDQNIGRLRRNAPSGLNENYARELLELHTLGVDGGYDQQDVIDVARIMTGWSIDRRNGFGFVFNEWAHDDREKVVMGHVFPPGHGMDEGERLLDLLASDTTTMRFVGGKLCAWFVNDNPPEACVRAAVDAWRQTDGSIRAVVRAILLSDAFWDPRNYGAKTKTPLEFAASALRAVGARPDSGLALAQLVGQLGQPPYLYEAPTGYPEDSEAWINPGALVARMNVALFIVGRRTPGITIDLDSTVPRSTHPHQLQQVINETILNGMARMTTLDVIAARTSNISNRGHARNLAVALALGSPEFQRQ